VTELLLFIKVPEKQRRHWHNAWVAMNGLVSAYGSDDDDEQVEEGDSNASSAHQGHCLIY
jgi:hypothetical protein